MNLIIMLICVLIFIGLFIYLVPIGVLIAAKKADINITIGELIVMRIRKTPVEKIVNALIIIKQQQLNIKREELEAIAFAGGNIDNVILGIISAKKKGLNLSFREASAEDLNGVNLIEKYSDY